MKTTRQRFYILLIAILAAILPLQAITVDEVPNVHVADRTQYVSNPSNVLSPAAVSRLNSAIGSLWDNTSAELVVVAVDQVDDSMTPDEFATRLFEKWKIGKKDNDNGVLVLLSRDDHKVIIRTGYGVEGVLPDIIAGRIIRNEMLPYYREDNYDEGTIAGISTIIGALSDPNVAEELKSKYANDSRRADDDLSGTEFFNLFLGFAAVVGVAMLILVMYAISSSRRLDDVQRYRSLDQYRTLVLFATFLSLGMALPAFLLLAWKMKRVRRHKRNCPHCGTQMELIDEEHDNDFLTPAQDTEERLNSIDYDVWHCPKCYQTEILPYINRQTNYTVCDRCGARAMSLVDRRTLRQPTVRTEGEGVDIYMCKNCGNQHNKRFRIAKKPDPAAATVAGSILGSTLGGHGGGGGFSGGSFGGGMTGGGGASGSW
ncbi:MAG: TPM domain-containing protein [Duncaniella sp.]|uniref:TPM domain-containing protein n=1 Tax=Duncaniella sp. TaxID=2518496 RepID=UPI0023D4ACB4|nr:TPM domain-containing protein [Duncaniella sp.]MDE6091214.1 TPM domain-containing protein [Duncaniella sp.]